MNNKHSLFDFCLDEEIVKEDNPFAPFTYKSFVEIFGREEANLVLFYKTLKINDKVIFDFSHMSSSWHLKRKHMKQGVITELRDFVRAVYVKFEDDEKSEFVSGIKNIVLLNGKRI